MKLIFIKDGPRNPRNARVVALNKPSDGKARAMVFPTLYQTFSDDWRDRSWYNRAGVERVMGFCEPSEYLEFMRQTPEFERMLSRSGIKLFKYWFSVTQEKPRSRFAARETSPLKRLKLSPIDRASIDRWDN